MKLIKKKFPFKEISFRASGWMIIFYLGVVKYIKEKYKIKNLQLTGSSGGAVAACSLLCDIEIDEVIDYLIEHSPKTSVFGICRLIKGGIDKYIISHLSNKKINRNTLNIACTIIEGKTYRTHFFNKFNSVHDVCNYLKGSVHVPIIGGIIPYRYNNYNMYDSIITDSHPHTTDDYLKVSWNKSCECGCEKTLNLIRPYNDIPLAWCVSPPTGVIKSLYMHGYYQAKLFFENVHDDNDVKICEEIEEYLKNYNKSIEIIKYSVIISVITIATFNIKRKFKA
jgi:hypothetical protein